MGVRVADLFADSSGVFEQVTGGRIAEGADAAAFREAGAVGRDAAKRGGTDAVTLGGPLRLPGTADALAGVRQSQALQFLARSQAFSLSLTDGQARFDLNVVSQRLAVRFASSPQGPVGLGVFEDFLEQSEALSDADVALLKEFLVLLRAFVEDDGTALQEFLQQVTNAFSGFTSPGLDAANAFLRQTTESAPAGLQVSVRAARLLIDVSAHTNNGNDRVKFRLSVTQVDVSITAGSAQEGDPLVLDLDDDGVELTNVGQGRTFDLNADGTDDQTAFIAGDDGFLALDRNGNGAIDDGGELFGDQHGARHGFAELNRFDDTGDGVIDVSDAIFHRLRVLHDINGDGRIELAELSALADLDIAAIDLRTDDTDDRAAGGNRLAQRGAFVRRDGSRGLAADVLLQFRSGD